jgi:uncharacterized protein
MITRFFLLAALFLFSNISFASSEIKIPELVGRAMFEGKIQPTESQKENLLAALRNLEKENKVQMGVLVVDSIKPYSIEEYSMMVAEKWKIGQKGVDNGVLMVVATKDRKARLEVGNGLQGSLTDAMTKRIQMEKMVPEFKKGQFVEGIIATVDGIKAATVVEAPVIANALEVKQAKEASEGMSPGAIFLLIFGGIAGIGGIVTYFVVKNSKDKAAKKRREADLAEYARRQSEYNRRQTEAAIASRKQPTQAENEHAQRMEARRRREAEYARQNVTSAPSLAKKPSSSSSSTKKDSTSSSSTSSGYSGYGGYSNSSNNDDDSRKSSYTPSSSSSSSSNDDVGGGGSFSGGGSSSEW